MRVQPRGARRVQAGMGLIEILVAVLILAIGLLGVAALQATSLRNGQSALERSQAVIHSYAILDAMRANLEVARNGGYNSGLVCKAAGAGGGSLVEQDRSRWLAAIHSGLGDDACGAIQCVDDAAGGSRCEVTVQWNDGRATAGSERHQVTTETRL